MTAFTHARLTAHLRRSRRHVLSVADRLDGIARTLDESGGNAVTRRATEELRAEVDRLRDAAEDSAAVADADGAAANDRGVDGGGEWEEGGRMTPPLREIVDQLRRRR